MQKTKTIGEPIPIGILTATEVISQRNAAEEQSVKIEAATPAVQPSWPHLTVDMIFFPLRAWTSGMASYLHLLQRLQMDRRASANIQ
jgi:hypothetical protein